MIRRTFDMLLDGQHTGRYRWEELYKTEKTHCGTVLEINVQREFGLADGAVLDYSVCGAELDCKYSQDLGKWQVPPEATGRLLLGLWASDQLSRWSAGVVRATDDVLSEGRNRDMKRTLTAQGRETIRWLFRNAPLPENTLLHLDSEDIDAIFGSAVGQRRVNELFRRVQARPVSRTVVATVAIQADYMKRVRGNGGARSALREEGIVVFGDYARHADVAAALRLPTPGRGEFVSARLAQRRPHHVDLPHVTLDGTDWVVARPDDPVELAPLLPSTKKPST